MYHSLQSIPEALRMSLEVHTSTMHNNISHKPIGYNTMIVTDGFIKPLDSTRNKL